MEPEKTYNQQKSDSKNTSASEKWRGYVLPVEKSPQAQLEAQGWKGEKLRFLGVATK